MVQGSALTDKWAIKHTENKILSKKNCFVGIKLGGVCQYQSLNTSMYLQ